MPGLPGLGAAGGAASASSGAEPKYLHYERRGLWGQASYNIGYSYFGGLAVGGEGRRTAADGTRPAPA